MLLMIILNLILHQMVYVFLLVFVIIELLVKQRIKIFMIYNGLRTLLKNNQDISLIVDVNRLTIYLSILITHQLLYVLMMLNYMVIGGMKVLTGYILLLKKCIMINVILH